MEKEIKKYLKRMKVLELKPNDIIVLESPGELSEVVYHRIKESISSVFPQNKYIVIEKMKLGVIRNKT